MGNTEFYRDAATGRGSEVVRSQKRMTIAHFRHINLAHDLHPPRRPHRRRQAWVSSPHGHTGKNPIEVTCARGLSARVCCLALWTSRLQRATLKHICLSLARQTCFECRLRLERTVDGTIKTTFSLNELPSTTATFIPATATQTPHIEQQYTITSTPATQSPLAHHVGHRQVVHPGHSLV